MAAGYDPATGMLEWLGLARHRRRMLSRARGDVLEVAAGTGRNLRFYPRICRVTAVDLSPEMLAQARRKALGLDRPVSFRVMDGENLKFPDCCFDTVVSSLCLCTFADPVAAVREMARVCRPEGRILLVEHGLSSWRWLACCQRHWARGFSGQTGCHWDRNPRAIVLQAKVNVLSCRRGFAGIIYAIEARP